MNMMIIIFRIMKINGSVALVTGANRGLGLAFAKALLERGAKKVYAAARDAESVTLPGVVAIQLDVTDPESVARLAAQVPDLTLLINNAGISKGKGALGANAVELARQEMETNYIGPLAISSAIAPILARNGGGAIVNVLSALSWAVLPTSATYSASKAAAWALTNGLRHELGPQGTQVVGLHVGFVDTDLTAGINAPKSKPEDVVKSALDTVESGGTEVLADDVSKTLKANLSNGVYLRTVG
jgi:NAD(P)-dependent dehydrogenase (short-subunit alcohol dehydrogenase family)